MNKSPILIDGSIGEGGGQILRTSLSLSAITNRPLVIENIRANRRKPGLLRQHLTCVLAAAKACNAQIEGGELGSSRLSFTPNRITAGEFDFSIGTAGSTILVAQTLMPILWFAQGQSTVKLTGGTHNDMAPSLCFFRRSFLPVLKAMGIVCTVEQTSYGFNPVGGGHWQLTVNPVAKLKRLNIQATETCIDDYEVVTLFSKLPQNICDREIKATCAKLDWPLTVATKQHVESPGPGNSLQIMIKGQYHQNMIEVFGQHGVSAETVAARAVKKVKKLLNSKASVGSHLADQLLLPMALASGGSFTTTKPSEHTLTNIGIIERFLAVKISVEQQNQHLWTVKVKDNTDASNSSPILAQDDQYSV